MSRLSSESLHVSRPTLKLRRAVLPAVFAGALAMACPSAAEATRLELRTIAKEVGDVTAGFGYVAWIEDSRGRRRLQRVVLRDGRKLRRSKWFKGRPHHVALERRVDQRTGRIVVRVSVALGRNAQFEPPTALLSPATLRPTKTRWPVTQQPAGTVSTADGRRTITINTSPVPQDVYPEPRYRCRGFAGPVELPPIEDCAAARVELLGQRVLLHAAKPSETFPPIVDKGYRYTYATYHLSLDNPALGWTDLGRTVATYDGKFGLQDACLVNGGIAILSGDAPTITSTDTSTWRLRFVPTSARRRAWSASAARIAPLDGGENSSLACSGKDIYAKSEDRDGGSSLVRVKPLR